MALTIEQLEESGVSENMADFRVELSLAHWLREMIVSDGGMLLNWIISQTIRNNV